MRLATTFVFSALAACILPAVGAINYPRAGSLVKPDAHKVSTPQVIVQRQYHTPRDLIDLCLSVDASVLAPILAIIDPLAAKAHICLCLQDLDIFLDSDIGILLGKLLGKNNLVAAIKLLINTSHHTQHCNFPTHSHHTCVAGNPCAFECDPPYVKAGKKCICPPSMLECNGICGSFPNGCGSAVPHHYKQRSTVGPITTFAQAQAFCQSKTVCGIAEREEITAFECIDTRATLDSCGGCVTPHRFRDATSPSIKGVDCGRLPGVVTSSCSDSRCIVTQCRQGWYRDAASDQSMCVKVSAGPINRTSGSRMKKERRDVLVDTKIVINADLRAKLKAYVGLVIKLTDALPSTSVPAPPIHPSTPTSHPPIDHVNLIGAVITVTADLLNSHTVVELAGNAKTIANITVLVAEALGGCGCVDSLGLGQLLQQLVEVVDAALDIKHWCGSHPIGMPAPHPPTTTTPKPPVIPNTSSAPIIIDLDVELNNLLSAATNHQIKNIGLTATVDDLLSGLGLGLTANAVVTLDSELLAKVHILVGILGAMDLPSVIDSTPNASDTSTSLPSVSDIVTDVVQAVLDLLSSGTVASFVVNGDTLVDVNAYVAVALGTCGCVGGHENLVKGLNLVADVALDIQDWCAHHPVGVPVPHPSGTPVPHSISSAVPPPSPSPSGIPRPPHASNDAVIIGLDKILAGFKARVVIKGLVGEGTANTLNNALDLLGIGPSGVLPRELGSPVAKPDAILQVDAELKAQLRTVVTLAMIVKNESSCLPAVSNHGPPISAGTSSLLAIDVTLVGGLLDSTITVINSDTVSSLLFNLDTLLQVTAHVNSSLLGCGCIGNLGLAGLVKSVEDLLAAVLSVQSWCTHHPVVIPINPHVPSSSLPSAPAPAPTSPSSGDPTGPQPPTGNIDISIDLGLHDLLSGLGVDLTGDIDAIVNLNSLIGGLVNVVINIKDHSSPSPPTGPPSPSHTPAPAPHPSPSTSPVPNMPIIQGLINSVALATGNLLQSLTSADVLVNVNALLHISGLLAEGLNDCQCAGPTWDNEVYNLLDNLLAIHVWCQNHPGVGGPAGPGGSGGGNGGHASHSSSIIINAQSLLSSLGLGLDALLQVDGSVNGLGEPVNGLANSLLQALGLGGVRRWFAGRR